MNSKLEDRTLAFAVRVMRMAGVIGEQGWIGKRLADQFFRAGTSVGAHYAEARGSRSDAEFIAKIDGALQELREAIYWMQLSIDSGLVEEARVTPLLQEAGEISAMLIASSKTVKNRIQTEKAAKVKNS